MRNRLIHAYFDVDLDRVWDTVKDDIPFLIKELKKYSTKVERIDSCHNSMANS